MTNEPIHIISLGAGVQSSTLVLMAACGEIKPMPQCAIFADTQAEPASVYTWLDWLEKQLPFPVHRVTVGSLTNDSLIMKVTEDGRKFCKTTLPIFCLSKDGVKSKVPKRACTSDYKLVPIVREERKILGPKLNEWRKQHRDSIRQLNYAKKHKTSFPWSAWEECQNDALIIQWIGISLDEAQRMKDSRQPYIRCRWPLIENNISRADCLRWMKDHGYPEPPRSACIFCPFHDDSEWIRLRDKEPEEFARAVQFERDFQKAKENSDQFRSMPFLHRSCEPLDKVQFVPKKKSKHLQGQLNFAQECSGMCGV